MKKPNLALTLHSTAWAGAGDGVLFMDADGDGAISNLAEYVFTEWDRTASDDMEAMRRVFDTDGDGKLTEADARWGEFRVMVTHADGTTTKSLAELGITEINLRPNWCVKSRTQFALAARIGMLRCIRGRLYHDTIMAH